MPDRMIKVEVAPISPEWLSDLVADSALAGQDCAVVLVCPMAVHFPQAAGCSVRAYVVSMQEGARLSWRLESNAAD